MRAALLLALWVLVSIPVALVVGAALRATRQAELAEQVDEYLRRVALGRRIVVIGHSLRVVMVSVALIVLAAGSLRAVSDVPERIVVAGIRNAQFFGPGPGSGATSHPANVPAGPRHGRSSSGSTAAARLLTALDGAPLTPDSLGVPGLDSDDPGTVASVTNAASSPADRAEGEAAEADEPTGEEATEEQRTADDTSTSPAWGGGAIASAPETTTTTTSPAPPPETTTATTATTSTTSTTEPPPETTTTTSTTSTTEPPPETTTTTSTTSTTSTTEPPPETTTTTTTPPPEEPAPGTTTTTTTPPPEEPAPADGATVESSGSPTAGEQDEKQVVDEPAATEPEIAETPASAPDSTTGP